MGWVEEGKRGKIGTTISFKFLKERKKPLPRWPFVHKDEQAKM